MKQKLRMGFIALAGLILSGCASAPLAPISWESSRSAEQDNADYAPFMQAGSGVITGQAFLTQQGGGVVVAAGREVILDPATHIAIEWWQKIGTNYEHLDVVPPSENFSKLRRRAIADASGKFEFRNLPAGKYFVRTVLTWNVPFYGIQGGVLGEMVEVKDNQSANVLLNHYATHYPDLK